MHAADNSILGVAFVVLALLGFVLFYPARVPRGLRDKPNIADTAIPSQRSRGLRPSGKKAGAAKEKVAGEEFASNLRLANESEVASVAIARNADGSIASCEIVGDLDATLQICDDLIALGALKLLGVPLELVEHDDNKGYSFFKRVKEGKDG